MTTKLEKVLYTADTHTTGGRLDVQLAPIGSSKPGTNPEQLFGVGYSACFIGAMQRAAAIHEIRMSQDTAVDASVSLGRAEADTVFALAVKLAMTLPGLTEAHKRLVVETAHQICPYSRSIRGNVDVTFDLRENLRQ